MNKRGAPGAGAALLMAGAYLGATAALSTHFQWLNVLHLTGAATLLAALWRGWRGVGVRELAAGLVVVAMCAALDGVLVALGVLYQTGPWRLAGALAVLGLSFILDGEADRLKVRWLFGLSALLLVGALLGPLLFLKAVGEAWLLARAILINALGLYLGLTLAAVGVGASLRTALSRL